MKLDELVHRTSPPEPWADGEKIPWHEPSFSRRMLLEHLSQEHDAASRRAALIDRHVHWIHTEVLAGEASRILDLGCGPGLYTSRLARLGHACVGIDYAPASIAYAQKQAKALGLPCEYRLEDLREASFGAGCGLVMMVHGELNVFRPEEIRAILAKSLAALRAGGRILLEVHTLAAVRALGEEPPGWYASPGGLFAKGPYLCLQEAFWDPGRQVSTERYFILESGSSQFKRYAASIQGFDDEEYPRLLRACGFQDVSPHPSLTGGDGAEAPQYLVLVAEKPSEA